MSNSQLSKRLVASFVQFLQDEMEKEGIESDTAESIDVARQCLHMAYTTTSDDVPKEQHKLIDIFSEACPPPPESEPLTDGEKQQADEFKQQGNECMKEEKFEEAVECYSKAIAIDEKNAVYFCNRAAAQTGRQKFDLSLTDCKKALEIDSKYSKAYSRMGLTYSKMEIYDEAISCYKKALELDPDNEGYKKNMKIAEEKQKAQETDQSGPSLSGMDGMPNFLNNPLFMNMAQQVMQNPAMQQMAMNVMSGMMGGNAPGDSSSGEGPQDMSQILQMGQQFAQQLSSNNPEMVEQLRSQMQNSSTSSDSKEEQS